jgi:hypothetical protein
MTDLIVDDDGFMPFHARCPNGHFAVQRHRPEDWKAGLSNARLMFQCNICEARWAPSLNDKATILSQLGR